MLKKIEKLILTVLVELKKKLINLQKGSQTVLFNIEKLINLQKETITVLIKIQKILLYLQKVHIDSEN